MVHAERQVHILMKPSSWGLKTNLVITTGRGIYHVDLDSTDKTYMAAVSWLYPEDQLFALKQQNAAAEAATRRSFYCTTGNSS